MTIKEFVGIFLTVSVFTFIVQQIDDLRINRKLDKIYDILKEIKKD